MPLRPLVVALATCALVAAGQGVVTARADVVSDPTLRTSADGTRFFVEPPAPAPSPSSVRTTAPIRATARYPLDQTFTLHSRPTSTRTIYLDFDGFTLTADSWPVPAYGIPAGSYPGFTLDGSAAFSDYEKAFVQEVWLRVSELFAPFDVDVTTQDGGVAAYTRTDAADDTYGVQVAITSSATAASRTCGQCAGLAPLGTFDAVETTPGELLPALVFTTYTYPSTSYLGSASLTAMAAAHEAGHTLGLSHDATNAAPRSYYAGHANWYPIMGMSDGDAAIGQWSQGEYFDANNHEDDLAVIARSGAPLLPDDHATAPGAPTDLGRHSSYRVTGTIGSDADNDWFLVDRGCSGPMLVKATGIGAGTALDLKVAVYDSAGTTVGNNNPDSGQTRTYPDPWWVPTGVDASVAITAAKNAPYRIRVEGVGRGNPSDTGYSGYGSVGRYTLTVSSCTTALPGPARPGAPRIQKPRSGAKGGAKTATARWFAPTSSGDGPITGFVVQAARLGKTGKIVKVKTYRNVRASWTSFQMVLPAGRYRFRLAAVNRHGAGAYSAYSTVATSR